MDWWGGIAIIPDKHHDGLFLMDSFFEMEIQSRFDEVPGMAGRVEQFLERWGANTGVRHAVQVVLEELVTNIIKASAERSGPGPIRIVMEMGRDVLAVRVTDGGEAFDPLRDAPPPILDKPLEERPIGGLGLHMMRNLSESIHYERADGRNVVTVRFRKEPSNLKERPA